MVRSFLGRASFNPGSVFVPSGFGLNSYDMRKTAEGGGTKCMGWGYAAEAAVEAVSAAERRGGWDHRG